MEHTANPSDPEDAHDAQDAASVTDELGELWRFGFDAARTMTERVLDLYQGLPSGLAFGVSDADTEAELRRLRIDLERAVDLCVDVFERVLSVARRIGVRDDAQRAGRDDVVIDAAPGSSGTAVLWIHNTSTDRRPAPVFRCTGLVEFDGAEIPTGAVSVRCSDAPIDPGTSRRVEVSVDVPRDTRAGSYHGVLISRRPDTAMAVRVEVTNGDGRAAR